MQDFKLEEDAGSVPNGTGGTLLSSLEDGFVVVAGFIVLALMLAVTADVILRSLFNYPLPNSYEYMELGMVFIVYLGASQTQRGKRHIAIDALTKLLPPRGRALAELLGCIVGLILMTGIGWWGAQAAWNSFVTAEYIGSVSQLPVLPARIALVCGVALLSLRLLADIWRYAHDVLRPQDRAQVMNGRI